MSRSNSRATIFFGNRQQMNLAFKIIAWLTVVSLFAGYGILGIKELFTGNNDQGVATVNGLAIPIEEFKRNYKALNNFITMAKSQYGANADLILQLWGIDAHKKTEDVVLEKLVQDKVVQSVADLLEIRVGQDYFDAKLQDMSFMGNFVPGDVFQGGRLNPKLLSEYLQNQNLNLDDFENQVREAIKKSVLLGSLDGVGYVPLSALKDEFIKKYAKRKYTIISADLSAYLDQVKEKGITDVDLEHYYKAHQEDYRVSEKRQANFWIFDPRNYGISIEDKEIADFFEKNKKSYLKEGASTENPVYKDLTEVREDVSNKVLLNKFTKQFGIDVNKVLIESKQSPTSLSSFISKKKAEALPIMVLTEDNSKQSQKIFELNKLKDKTYFVEHGKGYVGELVKIDKSYIPALKDISEKVRQDLLKQRTQDLAKEVLNAFAENNKKSMQEINNEVKGKLIQTDVLDPYDPETFKKLKDQGIKSDILFNLESIGQRTVLVTSSSGFVIQLDVVEPIDQDLFDKKKSELQVAVKRSQAQHVLSDWLKALEGQAKININHRVLAQLLSRR